MSIGLDDAALFLGIIGFMKAGYTYVTSDYERRELRGKIEALEHVMETTDLRTRAGREIVRELAEAHRLFEQKNYDMAHAKVDGLLASLGICVG